MKNHIPRDNAHMYYIITRELDKKVEIVLVLEHLQAVYDVTCALWVDAHFAKSEDWHDYKKLMADLATELDNGDLVMNPPPGSDSAVVLTIVERPKPTGITAADIMAMSAGPTQ